MKGGENMDLMELVDKYEEKKELYEDQVKTWTSKRMDAERSKDTDRLKYCISEVNRYKWLWLITSDFVDELLSVIALNK